MGGLGKQNFVHWIVKFRPGNFPALVKRCHRKYIKVTQTILIKYGGIIDPVVVVVNYVRFLLQLW